VPPCTQNIADFEQGQLSVALVVPNGPTVQGLERVVTFTISALALGVAARIKTGVEVSVGRDERTHLYKVTISSPTVPIRTTVSATDTSGNTVSAEAELGGVSPAIHRYDIDLPPGVELSPVVRRLAVELLTPTAVYERATAERRALVRAGLPDFVKQAAGVR
jgi:hypothetical protein